MLSVFDGLRGLDFASVLFRVAVAFLCGGAVGLERSRKNKPAGIRTHILICIGAAAASMTGQYLYLCAHLPTDVSRLGAQVVSGLGFIGAGTIIVTKKKTVKGLTTAAGLWASGIIGLAAGAGYYEGSLAAAALVLAAELLFSHARVYDSVPREFRLVVRYRRREALDRAMGACKDCRVSVLSLRVTGEEGERAAVLDLRRNGRLDREALLFRIRALPDILEVTEE